MHSSLLPLGALLSASCILCALTGADGAGKDQPPPLNPKGELKGFKAGEAERYVVWHGKGSGASARPRRGCSINSPAKFASKAAPSPASRRTTRSSKPGSANGGNCTKRHEINIDFLTDRGVDGINFQVSKEAKMIYFNLHIDGKHHKNRIFIGREGQHPEMDPFALPGASVKWMDKSESRQHERRKHERGTLDCFFVFLPFVIS